MSLTDELEAEQCPYEFLVFLLFFCLTTFPAKPKRTPPGIYGELIDGKRTLNARGHALFTQTLQDYSGRMVKLLRKSYPGVYRHAVDANLSRDEIEAACQCGLMNAISTWQPERAKLNTHASQWIRNAVQRAIREVTGETKAKEQPKFIGIDDAGSLDKFWQSEDDELNRSELHDDAMALRAKMEKLHKPCAVVLQKVYVEQKTIEETAVDIGVTPGTVRSRLARGVREIQAELAGEPGDRGMYAKVEQV